MGNTCGNELRATARQTYVVYSHKLLDCRESCVAAITTAKPHRCAVGQFDDVTLSGDAGSFRSGSSSSYSVAITTVLGRALPPHPFPDCRREVVSPLFPPIYSQTDCGDSLVWKMSTNFPENAVVFAPGEKRSVEPWRGRNLAELEKLLWLSHRYKLFGAVATASVQLRRMFCLGCCSWTSRACR